MFRTILFTAAILLTSFTGRAQAQQIILLKLDDVIARRVGTKPVSDRWLKVHDYLKVNHIKGSFGIITESLEKDNAMYFQWLKEVQAAGLIEFWMHGRGRKTILIILVCVSDPGLKEKNYFQTSVGSFWSFKPLISVLYFYYNCEPVLRIWIFFL